MGETDLGGYVTRGRANAIERELSAVEARLTARMDTIERELARVADLPLELVRAQSAAMLEVFRQVRSNTLAAVSNGAAAPTTRRTG